MVMSGTAPALIHGEAQGAESKRDFVHKMKLALQELREPSIALRIIRRSILSTEVTEIGNAESENNELIAIFVKSLQTAQAKENK